MLVIGIGLVASRRFAAVLRHGACCTIAINAVPFCHVCEQYRGGQKDEPYKLHSNPSVTADLQGNKRNCCMVN
jgi:hypothetical protein